MSNKAKTNQTDKPVPTKHQQVIDMLSREGGASLEEMSTATNWQSHSTRAFLTGLKKKGYAITSEKVDGVRRYHTTKAVV